MRITNSTVVRRYVKNLETNMYRKNLSENKITSNRKFSRASDDPVSSAKALRIRKAMSELKTYEDNLNTAKAIYADAETSLMKISELIQSTYEQLIYGANGTQGESENSIIADTIDQYADEMMRLMNVVVADRRIFGGTNNQDMAFTIEKNENYSTVLYNGKPVNSFQDPSLFPYANTSYTDIGIGMRLLDDGSIDPQSAFPVTFNGAEVMGCGLDGKITTFDLENFTDGGEYSLDVYLGVEKQTITFQGGATASDTAANFNAALESAFGYNVITVDDPSGIITTSIAGDVGLTFQNTPLLDPSDPNYTDYAQAPFNVTPRGYANNLIQLTVDAAQALRNGEKLDTAKFADALFAAQTNLSLMIADVGNKDQFLDFNLDRITNNLFTLSEQQNEVEYTEMDKEITTWKVMESLFNATLQMSASVIPMSIFNFM